MALQIPKEEVAAIAALAALPDASLKELVGALASAPLVLDTDGIAKQIAERIPSIPLEGLQRMLDTLYALYYIRETSGVTRSTFLEDLMDGIQGNPDLAFQEKDAHRMRARFERLLNIEAFNTLSKAERLQRDGERLYCDAKILSDIRPVFGAKPTARPPGAVITHTLRIGYHEGGDHKVFHVVLDAEDLEALQDVIIRAGAKDNALRKLLSEAKISNLGI